jgi:hypothetical protein
MATLASERATMTEIEFPRLRSVKAKRLAAQPPSLAAVEGTMRSLLWNLIWVFFLAIIMVIVPIGLLLMFIGQLTTG